MAHKIKVKPQKQTAPMIPINPNGPTGRDPVLAAFIMQREYKRGFADGCTGNRTDVMQICFAALGIAVHRHMGFGQKRMVQLLQWLYDTLNEFMFVDAMDAADRLKQETGLELDLFSKNESSAK